MTSLLGFLKVIEVGVREGARENKLEWEKKNQVCEELLR